MAHEIDIIYPPITDYYTQAEVDVLISSAGTGDVTSEMLTTTSGDLKDYVDQQIDLIDYTLVGTGGIDTLKIGDTWYIDGSNIEGGTTSSGVSEVVTGSGIFSASGTATLIHGLGATSHFTAITLAGTQPYNEISLSQVGEIYIQLGSEQDTVYTTGGVTASGFPYIWMATLSGIMGGGGGGGSADITLLGAGGIEVSNIGDTWTIDGSNIEGTGGSGGTIEHIFGMAPSGTGMTWGYSVFNGTEGKDIIHNLGSVDHSTFVNPSNTVDFNISNISDIGAIYIKKGINIDTVYTTGSGSVGQEFSWLAIQGWPYIVSNNNYYLDTDSTITTSYSGCNYAQGQDTGLSVTVSGGAYLIFYNLSYELSKSSGDAKAHIWVEDGYTLVENSQSTIRSKSTMSNVGQHLSHAFFVQLGAGEQKTYTLYAARDDTDVPDSLIFHEGSPREFSSGNEGGSSMVSIPLSVGGVGGAGGGGGAITLAGEGSTTTWYTPSTSVWHIHTRDIYGSGGLEVITTSGAYYINGESLMGPGNIIYTVGSGAGISWGFNTFSGMDGTQITHDLGNILHAITVTPAGHESLSESQVESLGHIYVQKGLNEDWVYSTATGIEFSWIASVGLPYYSAISDYTECMLTITGSLSEPAYQSGTEIMALDVPAGAWVLYYDLSYRIQSDSVGMDRCWVWIEDHKEEKIVDRSVTSLETWNPTMGILIDTSAHATKVTPNASTRYAVCAAKDLSEEPQNFFIYGSTGVSGSNSSFIAMPAYANGFFGAEPITGSGSNDMLIGTEGIVTTKHENGTWEIAGTSLYGLNGIDTTRSGSTWYVDGLALESSFQVASGIPYAKTKTSHLDSKINISSVIGSISYGAGELTGLSVTVSAGNWNLIYSVAYQLADQKPGVDYGYLWLEDDTKIVPYSSCRPAAWNPYMGYVIQYASNIINVAPSYTTTYTLRAAKDTVNTPESFYLHNGSESNGAYSSLVAIPGEVSKGYEGVMSLVGAGDILTTYDNDTGNWVIDGTALKTSSSTTNTATSGSLGDSVNITNSGTSIGTGNGYSTGLSVTVGSGNWSIYYSLSYRLQNDTPGLTTGLVWLEDGSDVIPESSLKLDTWNPLMGLMVHNASNMVLVSNDTATTYELKAMKHQDFYPTSFSLLGGPTASGAGCRMIARST